MIRAFAVVLAGCGRIGFDPTGGTGIPTDGPIDGPPFACVGGATASDPPASGGAFQLVRALGASPNAPEGTPRTNTVALSWEPQSLPIGASYAVIRTVCGSAIDLATKDTCTPTTLGSCLACNSTENLCVDDATPPSPAVAHYEIAQLDDNNFLIPGSNSPQLVVDVPVPPHDMVLLHRGSVNREICTLLGTAPDAANHHRCAFTGPGAVPLRAHPDSPDLGLPAGFYDFGYDLFLDRYEAACNWTHGSDGGKCGPGGGAGDCIGQGPTVGVPGNVFYSPFNARCYVHDEVGWQQVFQIAIDNTQAARLASTNDPGPHHDRPPLVYQDVKSGAAVCSSIDTATYGAKRLPRLRELVAAGAFQHLAIDPAPLSAGGISELESGNDHVTTRACNVKTHNNVVPSGFGSGDELARDVVISTDGAEAPDSFVIGSVATSNCVSRYGAQDLIGNVVEVISDQMSGGNTIPVVGIASTVDAGNTDLVGFALDGTTGAGPSFTTMPLQVAPKVLIPLAMPLAASAPFGIAPDASQLRNDEAAMFTTVDHVRMGHTGGWFSAGPSAGRFTTDFGGDPDGGNIDSSWGFRCAVAAVPR